ncbi:hypothetical protein [Streptomyces antibioticus]|uniref:hypothetical protein n=1 Tax=Streptomyces antibioticus TaxID=1890 RepID=UPI0033F4FEB2
MTEQEWLDSLAAQLPEQDLEWVVELARICSTQWAGDKPPSEDCSHPTRRLPGQAVLSSCRTAATARRWRSLTPTRINIASRRTKAPLNAFQIAFEGRLTPSNN